MPGTSYIAKAGVQQQQRHQQAGMSLKAEEIHKRKNIRIRKKAGKRRNVLTSGWKH